MPQSNPMDVVAFIQVCYLANGEMSISGNIGDKKLALGMLDHAREAVNNQFRPEDDKSIIIPNRDVEVVQNANYPTKPMGDMSVRDRGEFKC